MIKDWPRACTCMVRCTPDASSPCCTIYRGSPSPRWREHDYKRNWEFNIYEWLRGARRLCIAFLLYTVFFDTMELRQYEAVCIPVSATCSATIILLREFQKLQGNNNFLIEENLFFNDKDAKSIPDFRLIFIIYILRQCSRSEYFLQQANVTTKYSVHTRARLVVQCLFWNIYLGPAR